MEPIAWHILLLQLATFLIGAAALWFIALKPIRRILEQRRRRIAAEYKAGAEARRLAESLEFELRRRIAKLDEEAHVRARQAEESAARLREEARTAAKGEARKMFEQGRIEMRRERARMQDRMRAEVARLAVKMAVKVTGKIVGREERRRIVGQVISQLPSAVLGGRRLERSGSRRRVRRSRSGTA